MARPETHAEVVAVIERHVDDAHRRVLRSTSRFSFRSNSADGAGDVSADGGAISAVEVDMEDEVKSTTTHLLMEGARLIDEGKR